MSKTDSNPTERTSPKDLPLLTHTEVLGVDIRVKQRKLWIESQGGRSKASPTPDVEIEAWTGQIHLPANIRRELAAWSRRNLFDGATPS